MSFSRATLRGRVQNGMTFCSTSRSWSTMPACSSSFFDSSAVGMTVMSNSTSSTLSRGSPKSSSCRQVQSSSEDAFSLLSTMAMFWARVASSTAMPVGLRVIAFLLAPGALLS